MASDDAHSPTESVEELQARRFAFLSALYDAAGRVADKMTEYAPLFDRLELPMKDNWNTIMLYLHAEGLVKYGNGWVLITQQGLKEVETARTKPSQPSRHFPAYIVTHIDSLTVGVGGIAQVGLGNTASIRPPRELGGAERTAILEALAGLSSAAEAAQATDVVVEISDVRGRVKDPSISPARIMAALVGVSALVQGAGSIPAAYAVFKAALLTATGIVLP